MGFKMSKGTKGGYWVDTMPGNLNIMTRYDTAVMIVWLISLIGCIVLAGLLVMYMKTSPFDVAFLIAMPFFILGVMCYIQNKHWYYLIIIAVASALLYLLAHVDPVIVFFIDFTLLGSLGVVALVVAVQRAIFYQIVHSVEYLNVKEKMTIIDKLVAFMFNIPRDLDTRYLTMNYNLKRVSIPWGEMGETMSMSLMIGTFLWIYMSLNPAFTQLGSFTNAPLYVFSIVLYIPIIIMPWAIFRSLNVRIETKYRDFSLYSGIKETLKRMAIPVFAALMFILFAVNSSGLESVLGYIVLSVVMNVLILGLTSIIYYVFFEGKVVDDIVTKWKVFRPVQLLVEIDDGNSRDKKGYPGTPKRNTEEFGELVFGDQ
jgi:hypothetical protein